MNKEQTLENLLVQIEAERHKVEILYLKGYDYERIMESDGKLQELIAEFTKLSVH